MAEQLKIVIDADVNGAIAGVNKFRSIVDGLTTGSIAQLRKAALLLRTQLENLSPSALKSDFGRQLQGALKTVNTELKVLETQSVQATTAAAGGFNKAFQGVKQLANIIPGIGIAGLIGVAVTAIGSLTEGFFKAGFGATELDKAVDKASESIDKNAVSVITLVKALQSGTLSAEQTKKAKKELIDQAPEFQKSFDGDVIKIGESEEALKKYINNLVNTIKVTAALGTVNDALAKSFATVAKGGKLSFGDQLKSVFTGAGNLVNTLADAAEESNKNLQQATDAIKTENISKLIDETFKKLGISFGNVVDTIDDKGDKINKSFKKILPKDLTDSIITRARQFTKEFGDAFVVPDLSDSFFKTKNEILKASVKLLDDVKNNRLKIKIPVETSFEFINDAGFEFSKSQIQDFIDGIKRENNNGITVPLVIDIDPTLSKESLANIDKKLDFRKQFAAFGDKGLSLFGKIDFTKGFDEATKGLKSLKQQFDAVTSAAQGIGNAFGDAFTAILAGEDPLKAFFKSIIAELGRVIAKLIATKIAALLLNLALPGSGGILSGLSPGGLGAGGAANLFGLGQQIGSRANTLQLVGDSRISGNDIVTSWRRTTNSAGRFG